MKKIFALALCVMGTLSLFAETPVIDWSKIGWVDVSAAGLQYKEKFKVSPAEGQRVDNIQQPDWSKGKVGIYTDFPAGVTTCTLASAVINGAGVLLDVTGFTQQVTEVTVTCGSTPYVFYVYYSQGTTTDLEEKPSTLNMPNSSKFIQNGRLMIQTPQGTFSVLGQIK